MHVGTSVRDRGGEYRWIGLSSRRRPRARVPHRGRGATYPAPAPKSPGKLLYETDSNFLSMDGAAAGSGGRRFSPYTRTRHDADKGQLGASIQFDLVPKADAKGKASVPGRGTLRDQPVTRYYDKGRGLSDGRGPPPGAAGQQRSWPQRPQALLRVRDAGQQGWGVCGTCLPTARLGAHLLSFARILLPVTVARSTHARSLPKSNLRPQTWSATCGARLPS